MSPRDTHRLTRSSLELRDREGRWRRNAALAAVVLVLGLGSGGALLLADPLQARRPDPGRALARENAALRTELERLRTELELEKATRAELNREAVDLHARLGDLTNRLDFLAARDGAR
jgi:hypothetical protein